MQAQAILLEAQNIPQELSEFFEPAGCGVCYICHIVEVFQGVKRVLRPDGIIVVNMGDGYQDKQLLGMPWRVAFALQADGWWLRSAIVWAKGLSFCPTYSGSVMPESVTDRPTNAYEMVFLLSKSKNYYWDADAVSEVGAIGAGTRAAKGSDVRSAAYQVNARPAEYWEYTGRRNLRNVWVINPQSFKGAHFAVFPEKLVEPCILAGSSHRACGECGAPWERIVDQEEGANQEWAQSNNPTAKAVALRGERAMRTSKLNRGDKGDYYANKTRRTTTGWRPTCEHKEDPGDARCLVLDIFCGSGTTGVVCKKHGRDFCGIELSAEYCQMARKRLAAPVTEQMFK